tara:strand:+ start:1895 stop:2086 length:192 start_codon:yes stop_codon:yes gene_type:complete
MDQKGGDGLIDNIEGTVTNSVKAIEYFAKALCQIIDLGVEVGETAVNPNAPLSDPMLCDIPGT